MMRAWQGRARPDRRSALNPFIRSAAHATAALAVALSVASIPLPAGEPAPDPVDAEPGAAAAGALTREEVAALTVEIAPIVEEIRGARFDHPVTVEIVDDAAARAHFTQRLRKYWPEEAMRAEEILYAHLGLLPPQSDLAAVVFDVLEEQAGGYYDPDRDTFFVLGDLPRAAAPIIVAHELTHALDDQRFGIDALLDSAADDDDRAGALEAIVEGSGTAVMTVFIVRQLQAGRLDPEALREFQDSEMGRGERLKAAPLFVQRSVIAPYILGMAFLLRGEMIRMQTGGITPSDIDRAFREPPRSTEQILHPEKYWNPARRDPPRTVALPDMTPTLGDGWRLAGSGTLGELTVALVTGLDPGDPTSPDQPLERWTNAAATGWGGDRWQLYRNGTKAVSVFASVWDSERDAREFASALRMPAGASATRRGAAVVVVAGDAGGAERDLRRQALDGAAAAR
jgi:hypothetical protein